MTHLAVVSVAALSFLACGDSDSVGLSTDPLIIEACEATSATPTAVTATTDKTDTSMTPIQVSSGPVMITLTPGAMNYVMLESVAMHTDAAMFTDQADVLTHLYDLAAGSTFTLKSEGAASNCADTLKSDYRVHLHEPKVYQLELDGTKASTVWLSFLTAASDHSPTGDAHSGHDSHDDHDAHGGDHDVHGGDHDAHGGDHDAHGGDHDAGHHMEGDADHHAEADADHHSEGDADHHMEGDGDHHHESDGDHHHGVDAG